MISLDMTLHKNDANFQPLTPLQFLERAASIYPDRTAIVHGTERVSYRDFYRRSRQLASALTKRGLGAGDIVSFLAPNGPPMLEAHYGVPMSGAILNTINTRLDAETIAYIIEHGSSRVLVADRELSPTVKDALGMLRDKPLVIDIDDPLGSGGEFLGECSYEALRSEGDDDFEWLKPADEWDPISVNYTSGTTGRPKGVVFNHRGATLLSMGNVLSWNMPAHPVYLWTLPMFHANGWAFPWSISIQAGTHVCLRKVEPKAIHDAIRAHGVSHMCGAPIVMRMIVDACTSFGPVSEERIEIATAAAPPPAATIGAMEEAGFRVTHLYGLTETYGPAVVNAWHEEWDALTLDERASQKARQGVRYPVLEQLMVADPESLTPVPPDGETMGEVMFRGNVVMMGYLNDPDATARAFSGGWFHSGDLAVTHPDGYIELRDRSKDIIISGGENISSIEIEGVLYQHPDVSEASVVARPDEKWGESPCAFVTLRPDASGVGSAEIIEFCRERMAHFKAPRTVVFGELPKTSTGKVQKFLLRDRAREL